MANEKVMNRWLVVVGALLVQLCLGAIYAWSVFTTILKDPARPFASPRRRRRSSSRSVSACSPRSCPSRGSSRRRSGRGGSPSWAASSSASAIFSRGSSARPSRRSSSASAFSAAPASGSPTCARSRWACGGSPTRRGSSRGSRSRGSDSARSSGCSSPARGGISSIRSACCARSCTTASRSPCSFRSARYSWSIRPKAGARRDGIPRRRRRAASPSEPPVEMCSSEMLKTGQCYLIWLAYAFCALAGLMVIGIAKLFGGDALVELGPREVRRSQGRRRRGIHRVRDLLRARERFRAHRVGHHRRRHRLEALDHDHGDHSGSRDGGALLPRKQLRRPLRLLRGRRRELRRHARALPALHGGLLRHEERRAELRLHVHRVRRRRHRRADPRRHIQGHGAGEGCHGLDASVHDRGGALHHRLGESS